MEELGNGGHKEKNTESRAHHHAINHTDHSEHIKAKNAKMIKKRLKGVAVSGVATIGIALISALAAGELYARGGMIILSFIALYQGREFFINGFDGARRLRKLKKEICFL